MSRARAVNPVRKRPGMSLLSASNADEPLSSAGTSGESASSYSNLRVAGIAAVGFSLSGVAIAHAEKLAASGDATSHFTWFWLGFFAATLPVAILLLKRAVTDSQRIALVVSLACWSLVPKWIRTGIQPLYSDEFQHIRLLHNLARTGKPTLQPAILLVGGNFPGLELASSGLSHLTGISLQWSAVVIACVAHVAILIGIYVLVTEITRSVRAGAVAALVYLLNPGFLYFDAQYAYETLALAFVVWSLVFAARALDVSGPCRSSRERWFNVALVLMTTTALIFTHHVTAIFCALFLIAVATITTWRQRRPSVDLPLRTVQRAWIMAGYASLITFIRFFQLHQTFAKYLAPVYNIGQQFHQLLVFLGLSTSHSQRSLTGGSTIPTYELISTYLMIPIFLGLYVVAVGLLWRRRHELSPFVLVSVVLSLFFFASLPLDTSTTLAETVHRSWAYSFVGLALVLAAGSIALQEHGTTWHWRRQSFDAQRFRLPVAICLVASFFVVSFGSVSSGTDVYYRFGSPVVAGGDAVSIGTQTNMVAEWMKNHSTSRDVVFGDRYVLYPIIGATSALVSPKIARLWDFTFYPEITLTNLQIVEQTGITYMIVDKRMATQLPPLGGYWYFRGEPYSTEHQLVPQVNIDRYRCFNWMYSEFVTKDYTVYRVSRALLQQTIANGHIGLRKGCLEAISHG